MLTTLALMSNPTGISVSPLAQSIKQVTGERKVMSLSPTSGIFKRFFAVVCYIIIVFKVVFPIIFLTKILFNN